MNKSAGMIRKYFALFFRTSLFSNAWYITGVTIVPAVAGLIFWKLSALFLVPGEVGLGSAMLAAAGMLSTLAGLGINLGLVRQLPESENQQQIINTSLTLVAMVSMVLGSLFILGTPLWSADLSVLRHEPIMLAGFLMLTTSMASGTLFRGVFVARRKSSLAFLYTVLANFLRILLFLVLLARPTHAILLSNSIGFLLSLLVVVVAFRNEISWKYRWGFRLDIPVLKSLLPFSLSNFIATFLFQSYQTIYPLLVISFLGPDANSYVYFCLMIVGFVISPGLSLGYSAFSEGANDSSGGSGYFQRAVKYGSAITLILMFGLLIGARWILLFFGEAYAIEATASLRLMALSAPLMVVNQIYSYWLRFMNRVKELIAFNLLLTLSALLITVSLIARVGILAVSLGLVLGNLLLTFVALRKIIQLIKG